MKPLKSYKIYGRDPVSKDGQKTAGLDSVTAINHVFSTLPPISMRLKVKENCSLTGTKWHNSCIFASLLVATVYHNVTGLNTGRYTYKPAGNLLIPKSYLIAEAQEKVLQIVPSEIHKILFIRSYILHITKQSNISRGSM